MPCRAVPCLALPCLALPCLAAVRVSCITTAGFICFNTGGLEAFFELISPGICRLVRQNDLRASGKGEFYFPGCGWDTAEW
eukprot:SAG22_NODE_595_length_8730_cov_4.200672_3_plen_81_part_00